MYIHSPQSLSHWRPGAAEWKPCYPRPGRYRRCRCFPVEQTWWSWKKIMNLGRKRGERTIRSRFSGRASIARLAERCVGKDFAQPAGIVRGDFWSRAHFFFLLGSCFTRRRCVRNDSGCIYIGCAMNSSPIWGFIRCLLLNWKWVISWPRFKRIELTINFYKSKSALQVNLVILWHFFLIEFFQLI